MKHRHPKRFCPTCKLMVFPGHEHGRGVVEGSVPLAQASAWTEGADATRAHEEARKGAEQDKADSKKRREEQFLDRLDSAVAKVK